MWRWKLVARVFRPTLKTHVTVNQHAFVTTNPWTFNNCMVGVVSQGTQWWDFDLWTPQTDSSRGSYCCIALCDCLVRNFNFSEWRSARLTITTIWFSGCGRVFWRGTMHLSMVGCCWLQPMLQLFRIFMIGWFFFFRYWTRSTLHPRFRCGGRNWQWSK